MLSANSVAMGCQRVPPNRTLKVTAARQLGSASREPPMRRIPGFAANNRDPNIRNTEKAQQHSI
jgi:hypothetical protein